MRIAAARTLGVFLAVFAAGVVIRDLEQTLHGDIADEMTFFAIVCALLVAVLIGWLASIVLRHAAALASAVIFAFAGLAAAAAAYNPRMFVPDTSMTLTPKQREALHTLMTAQYIAGPAVGIGGEPSDGYLAMRELWHSTDADAAFKQLVLNGTPAGQLYGLIGVYRTDPLFFRTNAWRGTKSDTVLLIFGCVGEQRPAATFVSNPKALRLPRGMSLETWFRTRYDHKSELELDIAGGGYSRMYLDRIR